MSRKREGRPERGVEKNEKEEKESLYGYDSMDFPSKQDD